MVKKKTLKTSEEIELMHEGGKILSTILDQLVTAAKPGIRTKELDILARELCASYDVVSWFPTVDNFPAYICVSINEEVVHGVPSDRRIKEGDVVKIDLGITHKGFNTDSARTIIVGGTTQRNRKQKLIDVTREALEIGIEQARLGNTVGDISRAIHAYIKSQGFDVVRDLVGHGIGRNVHELPDVPNYDYPGNGDILEEGLVLAIEPMVVEGSYKLKMGPDGFAFVTADGKLAAQFEHTVAITSDGPLVLTQ